jgi:protoheme ferro-lyase
MRIGVILLDHGEPPEYNEHTYYSFKNFATSLINMGFIPKIVLKFDRGTILQERNEIYAEKSSPNPELIDAWLHPYKGFTYFIPEAKRLRVTRFGIYRKGTKPHYLARKTGPGHREPDFYEMYGFEIHDRWSSMGGRSPFYDQTQPQKEEVARKLKKEYGDRVEVRFAYGIDPFPEWKNQTPEAVVRELVREKKISHLVVSEHFSVTTDSMSTFHLRKHVEHALHEAGTQIPVVYADQLGGTKVFNEGVILKIQEELNALPKEAKVAIFLSNHGFPTTKIGKYDAAKDCYHQNVKKVFESAKEAIIQEINWGGEFRVTQVFGQFLEKKYNPDYKMMSPLQALELVSSQGFEHVIDIPYEFPGDSVDVLVKLRTAYGLERLPNWNEKHETKFKYKDVNVKITSASFKPEHWIDSYTQQTIEAIENTGKTVEVF